ncbi:hypothetical protein SmJEL517_g02996 [Synchytrium microbalum]|uniref:Intraflagellar transport protein 74 n=1 Tax=Synchytrium microbalum TaxID=1806994 RepID=A0A507BZZ3_9FUNG|nr:uncharacterized protein SmJEL517_g02996 [Synchytrium microbalum]TPX34377.1 hypothetical protein SmJEL517_g02996 [Synchytrium microbalum]
MYGGRPPTGSLANRPASRAGQGAASWGRAQATGGTPMPSRPPVPQTASRVPGTARPGTMARGFGAAATGNVPFAERPMTQHGLGGLKTGAQGPGRLVQDRTFFQTELRRRITLVNNEIAKLQTESDQIDRENSNTGALEKRADSLADEIRDLQGQLADLNTLIDRLSAGADLEEVERQRSVLKEKNMRESRVLDDLFAERQQKEAAVREAERLVEEERKKAEAHVEGMDPESRREYRQLKEKAANLSADIDKQQTELDDLSRRSAQLESELGQDPLKHKAAKLRAKLAELQTKREELESTSSNRSIQPQDKASLLHKVKEDNQEIATMERRIADLEDRKNRLLTDIEKLAENADPEESSGSGEKSAKYEELVKRDREMQTFLDAFDANWRESNDKNSLTEKKIVTLLDRLRSLSEKMGGGSRNDADEGVVQNTVDGLSKERDRKTAELEKVLQMESKLASEMATLNDRVGSMNADLRKFANVDAIKREAEQTRKKNMAQREILKKEIARLQQDLPQLTSELEAQRAVLNQNETHLQLAALESRVKHIQEEEAQVRECKRNSARIAESDYGVVKSEVITLVDEINSQLIKMLSIPKSVS